MRLRVKQHSDEMFPLACFTMLLYSAKCTAESNACFLVLLLYCWVEVLLTQFWARAVAFAGLLLCGIKICTDNPGSQASISAPCSRGAEFAIFSLSAALQVFTEGENIGPDVVLAVPFFT